MNVHVRFGYRALRWAALFGIASLALMVWGVLDPRPIALVIAMSVGQGLGTIAFLVFCLVVLTDLRNSRVFARISSRISGAPPESR